MKKEFQTPEVVIVALDSADVLTISEAETDNDGVWD